MLSVSHSVSKWVCVGAFVSSLLIVAVPFATAAVGLSDCNRVNNVCADPTNGCPTSKPVCITDPEGDCCCKAQNTPANAQCPA